ncbi:MAG: tyrosine-type recombinase/integrase, partial [Candidatus Nanopelagicales bacterium]
SFTRKSDAYRFAKTVDVDISRGQFIDPQAGTQTLAEFADFWLSTRVWRQNSRRHAETHLRAHILPAFGTRPLASIRPSEIEAFKARLVRGGLAPATVEGICRHLAAILKAAQRDQVIARNPAEGISFVIRSDRRSTAADRVAALTPAQLQALIAALPQYLRAFAWTQALAGLRPGEAMGLTIDRVDLTVATLTVDRQLAAPGGPDRFAPPKTPSSVRTLHLADDLVAVLAEHLATYGTGPHGLIFRTRHDRPLRRSSMSDVWRAAATGLADTDLALPPAARGWHSLRHTFASAHLEAGTPITTVSRMLGHKTIAETSAVYSHMLTGSDHTRRNAAADVLRPRGPTPG